MEKYQEDNPNNARVFIDYTGKKEKVKFEYVKTNGVFKIVFIPIFNLWMIINIILMSILFYSFGISYLIINGLPEYSEVSFSLGINWTQLIFPLSTFFYILGVPFLITFIFTKSKRLIKLMPRINYLIYRGIYYAKFESKDVKNNQVKIPLFSNVGLDYTATKEFSKYLERFEIVEHPFNILVRKKKKPNEYLWKATFYFSHQPKTGNLKVRFR